jgi:hypothetical protein
MATAKDQNPQISDEPAEFPLTLEEYCTRVSATDQRVELLNAFAKHEIAAGHRKDVSSAFDRRYVAFANQPA